MLFNSPVFLTCFLPIALIGYLLIRASPMAARQYLWVTAVSLFFYAWWKPPYLLLLAASIGLNYGIGRAIAATKHAGLRRLYLFVGVAANLGAIGYFKYSVFLRTVLYEQVLGQDVNLPHILLPLGISFFTFQQMTYLIDASRGQVDDHSFLHYTTFVTFFPQLIAGPIVHHRDMLPQFEEAYPEARNLGTNVAIGVTIFAIGLAKKVLLADAFALTATPLFQAALKPDDLPFFDAWFGVLSYTFQLYFDFSGYSDMAVGLARMFGIILPVNFLSPYKSRSIVEFWRRWHVTLSRFLLDYLYIPLGGNRLGRARQYGNLMITMVLGGIWHGAGWTFIAWGALHGVCLCISHAWQLWRAKRSGTAAPRGLPGWLAWLLTFMTVVVGWVFFRAESLQSAIRILEAMFVPTVITLPRGLAGPLAPTLESLGVTLAASGGEDFVTNAAWLVGGLTACLALPNVAQIFAKHRAVLDVSNVAIGGAGRLAWQPRLAWAVGTGVALFFALRAVLVSEKSEFLYFNF